ncbi:major facilitator superfamily MFS_1 [Paraburkholderia atlantica]|uniref:Major facilitator superfamily MFS_1 n=1 Tax=Paraburkholderia atlantica TaxID=2654982 RepID=D5WFD7_PARAM|nr:MFS transporter [Paraburkholderia atlantica]ADG19291.1 major facilitator superfamily MFS_1 [Paraburkholderia atlantica]
MSTTSTQPAANHEAALESLYRRVNWRILPFLLICYLFAALDRLNIGFAKLQMQSDLGLSDAVYGLGAGIFFLGYVLFEIPSNLLLPKLGVRRTMARILVLWGLTSASMMFVRNVPTFYTLRFLLGVFEAGFAPGIIFYLTYWYGEARMARAIAIFLTAGPLSGVVGGPLSAWAMTTLHDAAGLAGWQWVFLIEGLPSVVLGILAWFVLADRPETARWLSSEERATLQTQLRAPAEKTHRSFASVARDPWIYLMAAAYFCVVCGIYAVNFWLPSILRADGVTDPMRIGFYSTIPFIAAVTGMVVVGRSSDRSGERRWHSALPSFAGGVSLAIAATSAGHLVTSLLFMTIATLMMFASYTVFWAIPSDYLKGDAAAGGIALINTIGQLGGFLSPTIIGFATTATGSLRAGLYVMVALLVIGACLMAIRLPRPHGSMHEKSSETFAAANHP